MASAWLVCLLRAGLRLYAAVRLAWDSFLLQSLRAVVAKLARVTSGHVPAWGHRGKTLTLSLLFDLVRSVAVLLQHICVEAIIITENCTVYRLQVYVPTLALPAPAAASDRAQATLEGHRLSDDIQHEQKGQVCS